MREPAKTARLTTDSRQVKAPASTAVLVVVAGGLNLQCSLNGRRKGVLFDWNRLPICPATVSVATLH